MRLCSAAVAILATAACGSRGADPPESLGAGFVDLTETIAAAPFAPMQPTVKRDAEPTAGLIADLDGDGAAEVVLSPTLIDWEGGVARTAGVYRHVGGRLEAAAGLALAPDEPLLGALDLDGDGVTDLLTALQQREVAWGLGGGAFAPAAPLDPDDMFGTFNIPAAYPADLDDDGWLDLLVGQGSCMPGTRELRPLLRVGERAWRNRVDLIDPAPLGQPYAVLDAELPSGDRAIMSLGRSCSSDEPTPVFYRRAARGADGYPRWEPFDPVPGDVDFDRRGPTLADNSPMGGALADVDGDGALDLAVSLNPKLAVFAGRPGAPFVDRTGWTGADLVTNTEGNRMIPWGIAFLDLDQDGRDDLLVTHGNDYSSLFDASHYIGTQRTSLHWNRGEWAFADVTDLAGLGREGQWKALAFGDLDGDGDADLIVGGQSELPRVYRNDVATGNHGFALRLRGTTSNHLGVGARVSVMVTEGAPERLFVAGGHGEPHAVVEPLVFVGLGAATSAAAVTVTWPSGRVQALVDVAAGTVHTIDEPWLFALTPAGRHLPADGVSRAQLLLAPDVDAATAEWVVLAGPGAVERAGTAPDGSAIFEVAAPVEPGSTLLELRVGGVAAGVRPRLWWDDPTP